MAEHGANLQNVLTRSRKKGVKLNSDKIAVRLNEVPYFRHILSADGLKPDPGKIATILDMGHPRECKAWDSSRNNKLSSEILSEPIVYHAPDAAALAQHFWVHIHTPQARYFRKSRRSWLDPLVETSKHGLGVLVASFDEWTSSIYHTTNSWTVSTETHQSPSLSFDDKNNVNTLPDNPQH